MCIKLLTCVNLLMYVKKAPKVFGAFFILINFYLSLHTLLSFWEPTLNDGQTKDLLILKAINI